MDDLVDLHRRGNDEFGRRVHAVRADQWSLPTPCADWDVRALVHHLVYESLWAPPLFDGATMADVGDRFEGDILGDDPVAAFDEAAAAAHQAVAAPGALDRTVHLSFGDVPGSEYATQLIFDLAVHAWDLGRAIGFDGHLDTALVDCSLAWLRPNIELLKSSGLFADPVEVGADAPPEDQLVALTGREP